MKTPISSHGHTCFSPGKQLKLETYSGTSLTYNLRFALNLPQPVECSPETWLLVWNSARQAICVPNTARAACHTLAVLLQSSHLQANITGALIDNTLFGGSSNGPSALTDTSLLLMTNALRSNSFENGSSFEAFCLKILRWLSMRWTLRKFAHANVM